MKSAARVCPRCGATLVFRDHFPVLTEVVKRPPVERRAVERLRYVAAWICVRVDCDYSEPVNKTA